MWKRFLLFCATCVCIVPMSACNFVFYQPDSVVYATPDQIPVSFETVAIPLPDKSALSAWKIKSATQPARALILHFHGNAQNMTSHFVFPVWLTQLGYDVLTFDYRGYGASPGKATRQSTVEDGRAALRFASTLNSRVVVLGQSLGGAIAVPALVLEQTENVRAVVLESSFYSYRHLAQSKLSSFFLTWPLQWPLSFLVSDELSPQELASPWHYPTLVLHGDKDPVVDISEGKKLASLFDEKLVSFWTLPGLGHTPAFALENYNIYPEKVAHWIDEHIDDQRPSFDIVKVWLREILVRKSKKN